MRNKLDANIRARRTAVYVSLVFLILAISLQALVWLYWNKSLEPRLRREAASQANVLAHSQAIRLANAILDKPGQRLQGLRETINEILLFTDSASGQPLFLGLDLEIDYDVVDTERGSLDIQSGTNNCRGCFLSEVGLYSPHSDELIGIARFHVSERLFRTLSNDVRKTLFTQSSLGTFLLLVVWGAVMFLIREINRSRWQAEAANRAKSAFLANMSHELRTPLNAIIGFSELMGFDADIPEKQHANLAIINRSGEYLLELINDVLELSKIEAARDTLTENVFDLYDVLNKVTEMIGLRAEKKNLQLVFERSDDIPRFIKSDERKLRQILLNLLGNAVKFTEEGGVALRVRRGRNVKGKACSDAFFLHFEVDDSGPGIAPEDITRIFEAFSQTQIGYDKKEGTGLGLAISRQFAHHLGGDIDVSSDAGKGAVFKLTIQAKSAMDSEVVTPLPASRVTGLKPVPGAGRNQQKRILVVDDNSENRTLLRLLLERVGFFVETAENGHQAIALTEKFRPHLIWMDMRMPVMDGYEATQLIHKAMEDKLYERPKIIALTASAFKEDRDAVLAAGCDDFVRRPFRESEIFEKIHEHLGVDFIYETVEETSSPKSDSDISPAEILRSGISLLPGEVIEKLKTAIELSDMEQMDRLVDDIRIGHQALASELKKLIDTFQYDHMLALLDRK